MHIFLAKDLDSEISLESNRIQKKKRKAVITYNLLKTLTLFFAFTFIIYCLSFFFLPHKLCPFDILVKNAKERNKKVFTQHENAFFMSFLITYHDTAFNHTFVYESSNSFVFFHSRTYFFLKKKNFS